MGVPEEAPARRTRLRSNSEVRAMRMEKILAALAAVAAVALETGPALAQAQQDSVILLPAPAILGLVAAGIGAAVVIARRRK
jgi:hypothetical protein